MTEFATLQHATYTEAEWTAWDGILLAGQVAYSSDALYSGTNQMKVKVGNGTDTWTALDYVPEPSGFTGGSLTSAINEAKGSDIASASTTDIGAATGNFVHVTGTTTITALGTIQAGTRRIVRFAGALTLTHNATSLILPTGANITTAANDVATFVSEGSGNWCCVNYTRADGSGLLGSYSFLSLKALTFSPADGLSYHFVDSEAPNTNGAIYRFYAPSNIVIKKAYISFFVATTPASTETSSIYIRVDNTTDTLISNAVQPSSTNTVVSNTSLNLSISAGSYFNIKWTTPTWATNPTNMQINAVLEIANG